MKSLSRNSKRVLLEKIAQEEIKEVKEEPKSFVLSCYVCKLFANLNFIRKKLSEKVNKPSACIRNSDDFYLELTRDRKEAVKDNLDIGEQLSCCALDDVGLPYSISGPDTLEDLGMHITTNPGFGYSKS